MGPVFSNARKRSKPMDGYSFFYRKPSQANETGFIRNSPSFLQEIISLPGSAELLHINRFESVTYLNKEKLEQFVLWVNFLAAWFFDFNPSRQKHVRLMLKQIVQTAEKESYRLKQLLNTL